MVGGMAWLREGGKREGGKGVMLGLKLFFQLTFSSDGSLSLFIWSLVYSLNCISEV